MKQKIKIMILFLISFQSYCQETEEIQNALVKKFPQKQSFTADGVWIYDSQILPEKLKFRFINKCFPDYEIYKVIMFYYLDHHVLQPECVILFNKKTENLIFVEPIAFKTLDQIFYKRLIGSRFKNEKELKRFTKEFCEIFFLDSGLEVPMSVDIDDAKITILAVIETNKIPTRKIEILLEKYVIKEIRQLNPKTGEVESFVQ